MYAYKLAILGLCSTAVVWAYPNAKALALVVPANANLARQIHNADYHAASPPTTPNQAQAAAEASPSTSPNETANPKPDANSKPDASSPASTPAPIAKETPKDKRENSPNSNNAQNNVQQAQIDGVAPQERSTLVSRLSKIASDWQGLSRRDVEEITNINNRNFDHDAVTRWSRAEVDKMEKWSK